MRGNSPVEKGYSLSLSEKIVRRVINEIMCNQYINWEGLAQLFSMDMATLKTHIRYSEEDLKTFESEGLLEFNSEEFTGF